MWNEIYVGNEELKIFIKMIENCSARREKVLEIKKLYGI
jgi:hypothetical protein